MEPTPEVNASVSQEKDSVPSSESELSTKQVKYTTKYIIKRREVMPGLTPEQIQALMSGSGRKGLYRDKAVEFLNSGEGGVCVQDEWALEFDGKSAATIKQGFQNVKDNTKNPVEGAENLLVINNDDKTFLINTANANVPTTE